MTTVTSESNPMSQVLWGVFFTLFQLVRQNQSWYFISLEEIVVAQDVAITTYEFAYFACNRIVTMPFCGSYVPSVDVYAVRGITERIVDSMNSGFPKHRDVALPVRLLAC